MIHRLARKHFFKLGFSKYPISFNGGSFCYLNLNINSQSKDPYKFYPDIKNSSLAKEYIILLNHLSETPKEKMHLEEENILFTQGSVEAIDLIIRGFCEPGHDAILITTPTFSYYAYRAAIEDISVVDSPLEGEDLNLLNKEEILKKNAKVLFLNTPSNPVGTALRSEDIEYLVKEFKGIVVVDEAYIEWTNQSTCAMWIEKYDNLIILRTFSKIWGLAGVRCGVVLAQKNIIELLCLIQPMFNFPQSSVELVSRKMKELDQVFDHKTKMAIDRKDFFNFLSALNCVEKVYPGIANFLFVKFKDAENIQQKLFDAKILVCNTSSQMQNTLRISVGTEQEMQRMKQVLLKIG